MKPTYITKFEDLSYQDQLAWAEHMADQQKYDVFDSLSEREWMEITEYVNQ